MKKTGARCRVVFMAISRVFQSESCIEYARTKFLSIEKY
jgi:hypothetical protein